MQVYFSLDGVFGEMIALETHEDQGDQGYQKKPAQETIAYFSEYTHDWYF